MKKAYVLLTIVILLIGSCGPIAADPKREWTLMIYTAEDNELETYAFRDYAKLLTSPISDTALSAHMLIDTTHYGSWDITFAGNPYKKDAIDMVRINNQNMSDVQTITQFIQQSVKESPANHYAIIFQGHGSGWYLSTEEGKSISVATVAQALQQAGVKFEFIGLDMCLMATLETAHEFRNSAHYVLASEDYGPWEGQIDPGLLEALSTKANTLDVLKFMSDAFIARNDADETADPADISILDTSGTEAMAAFLAKHKAEFEAVEHLFDQTYAIDQTLQYYQLQDLYSVAEAALGADSAEMREFKGLFNNIVLHYQQTQKKQAQMYAAFHHGLSIVVNGSSDSYDTDKTYAELSFPVILTK